MTFPCLATPSSPRRRGVFGAKLGGAPPDGKYPARHRGYRSDGRIRRTGILFASRQGFEPPCFLRPSSHDGLMELYNHLQRDIRPVAESVNPPSKEVVDTSMSNDAAEIQQAVAAAHVPASGKTDVDHIAAKKMCSVLEKVEYLRERACTLGTRHQTVGAMVAAITKVRHQTNPLTANATIDASHANEVMLGLVVVA